MKLFILLISCLFLLSVVSANGLNLGVTGAEINKTFGTNTYLNLNLKNDEAFAFYNITSDNDALKFDQIPILQPNSNINFTALVNTNVSSNFTIRIKGMYDAPLGNSNNTFDVNVDYSSGISNCEITATKGDKVIFKNLVLDDIIMENVETVNPITTIIYNASYTMSCDYPQNLKYNFERRGFIFTNVCNFYCLNDTGKINNPSLDAIFNLKVNILFNTTQLSSSFSTTSYTIENYQSSDGVIILTNTGSNVAKNVQINSLNWITFSQNNFDISPGQIKAIAYTIRPILTKTEDTNKTYQELVSITGNFNQIDQNISVFVPYMYLTTNSSSTYPSIVDIIKQYCIDYPQDTLCTKTPIYLNGSGTDQTFNVTYSQDQVKKLQEYQFQQGDSFTIFQNWVKEYLSNMQNQMTNVTNTTQQSTLDIATLRQDKQDSQNLIIFLVSALSFIIIATLLFIIIFQVKQRKLAREVTRY